MPLVLRLLILLGIAMLPAVVLQLHFRAEAQAAREATAREGVLRLARLVAADQGSIAEGARQLLTMLGSLAALREGGSPETCSRILGEALREAPRYAELKVIGLDGVVTCSGQPLNLGHDHSERAYFRRALQEDGFVVGDYAIGRGTGLPSLHYAQPFRDAEGRSIGVVAAALDLGWLARRLALAAPPPPGGSVLITDRAATVLARLPDPERHLGKRATGVSGHLGQREVGFDTIPGLDGRPRLMAFAPLSLPGQGLLVAAGIEEPEVLAGLKAANRAGLLMILGGGVMALALAWMTARRFLRAPVAALLATAERWRAGDLAARATSMPALRGEDARSEFGRIALAFDAVADALAERERTMADRETRLRLLADAIPAGIFHFDAERRFRFANAAGMDWLGQPRDTLLGRRLEEVIDAAAYARARPRIERALAGERVSFENRIVPPGGPAPRDLLISYVPQRDADGRIIGFYSLASDITARKAAEAELHESEARFRRIAEAVEDVIGVWEAETGQVLYLSPAYARIFGRPMPALPCANGFWGEAIHPEDRPHVLAAFAAGAGIGFDVEYRILWPDGQERWIRDRAYPLPAVAGQPRCLAGLATDITERRQAEARMMLLAREVDHRAKNVLAVVQSVLRLTRAEDPAAYAEAVEGRVAALSRAHSLLAKARWTGTELRSLAEAELAAHLAAGRVVLDGPPAMLAPSAVQPLAMVLHELATNAAKYGALSRPEGRVALAWRREAGPGGALHLRWTETGGPALPGPPARRGFGSTLIEATIRAQLGGTLRQDWLATGLGIDLTVAPRWLLGMAEAAALAAPEPPRAPPPQPDPVLPGLRVLVAEDEAALALELRETLQDLGCEVIGPVATLPEALRLAQEEAEGLGAAILDVNLGGSEVYPLAALLRRHGVPVLYTTGYAELPPGAPGAAPALRKPVSPQELAATLASLARGREEERHRPVRIPA